MEILPTPTKGTADWRDYRAVKLANGLTLLLVHDATSRNSSAACAVSVGASSDPPSKPGLAHFCEHMCFLGSEKYPGENHYKELLSLHGGGSNASTSMDYTNYKFHILAPFFEEALDVFSNFFVAPLFTQDGTGREINAVDSEDSKNRMIDGRRRLQVVKSLIPENQHVYQKFSTGNISTLVHGEPNTSTSTSSSTSTPTFSSPSDDSSDVKSAGTDEEIKQVRESLLFFHSLHYSPSSMTVVVVGPQSLDDLQRFTVPKFQLVPPTPPQTLISSLSDSFNSSKTKVEILEAHKNKFPLTASAKIPPAKAFFPNRKLLTMLPIKPQRKLKVSFPIPPQRNNKTSSPLRLISHLLGHEGIGSSFAHLQDAGLVTSLCSGSSINDATMAMFSIDLTLTEEGEEKWQDVAGIIFMHIRLLATAAENKKDSDLLQALWTEEKKLHMINFDQTPPRSAYSTAPNLASSLLYYDTEECLVVHNRFSETVDIGEFKSLVKELNPQNSMIERSSPAAWKEAEANELSVKQTEKWYGVEFMQTPIDEAVDTWERSNSSQLLSLPALNRFIPRSLEIDASLGEEGKKPRIERPLVPPNLVKESSVDEKFKLYHRLDDRYANPKASITVLFRNPKVHHLFDEESKCWEYNNASEAKSSLFQSMFAHVLAQETYDASLANLGYYVSLGASGVTLRAEGYNDRLSDFSQFIVHTLLQGCNDSKVFTAELLGVMKDRRVRSLESFMKERPDSHANYYTNMLYSPGEGNDIESRVEATKLVTMEELRTHIKGLFEDDSCCVEALYTGNVNLNEARGWFEEARANIERKRRTHSNNNNNNNNVWTPSPSIKALNSKTFGSDVQIHMQSPNPLEENGALFVKAQCDTTSFTGIDKRDLKRTASFRVLNHMLREPLFNELRTKQALGYIVTSGMESEFSSSNNALEDYNLTKCDSLYFLIVSKKVSPLELGKRLDNFLTTFEKTLESMGQEEVDQHSMALQKKMMEPHKNLNSEANEHLAMIRRFSPMMQGNPPFKMFDEIAEEFPKVTKGDVLDVYRNLCLKGRGNGKMVSSFVYGNKFVLDTQATAQGKGKKLYSVGEIRKFGKRLPTFALSSTRRGVTTIAGAGANANGNGYDGLKAIYAVNRRSFRLALGGAVVLGVFAMFTRGRKSDNKK